MATGVSRVADLNSLFNTIFNDAWFVARERNIMGPLVTGFSDRTGDEDRKSSTYPQIVAQTVGETDDFTNPTRFDKQVIATLTPGEVMAQTLITDRRIETDPQNAASDASLELGLAMGDKAEADLLSVFSSLTGGTIGSAGTTLAWGHFFAARSRLRGQKVPGPYVCVLHEYQWHPLAKSVSMATSPLTNVPAGILDQVARQWYVGTVAGVDIFTTANMSVDGSDDAIGAMYNRAAIAFDSRRPPRLEPERDASRRAWELNISAKYAYGVWRPAFGVKILSDASVPTQ